MTINRLLTNDRLVILVVAVLLCVTLIADLRFPLGTATWVVYLLPTVIAYASHRPYLPYVSAIVSVIFTVIGFDFAPQGIDPAIAMINRALATGVDFTLATIGMFFIRYRNEFHRQEWLSKGEVSLGMATAGDMNLD